VKLSRAPHIDILVVLRGPVDPGREISASGKNGSRDVAAVRGGHQLRFHGMMINSSTEMDPSAKCEEGRNPLMTEDQKDLLEEARDSISAADLLLKGGFQDTPSPGLTMRCFILPRLSLIFGPFLTL